MRDKDETLIRSLDATTTTEALVLDASRTLVCRGAVDDQYGFGYSLKTPRKRYLADAINAVLKRKTPDVQATIAPGWELFFESAPQIPTEVGDCLGILSLLELSTTTWALSIESANQPVECSRLRECHNRFERQRVMVCVVAVSDSAKGMPKILYR